MTEIDFYVLSSCEQQQRVLFACKLTEKALRSHRRVLIAVDDRAQAEALDSALWDFKPESFIPHHFSHEHAKGGAVAIDYTGKCDEHHDVLISLTAQLPEYFSRFARLAEVVIQQEPILTSTRKHWSFFTQRGYPIRHHKL